MIEENKLNLINTYCNLCNTLINLEKFYDKTGDFEYYIDFIGNQINKIEKELVDGDD